MRDDGEVVPGADRLAFAEKHDIPAPTARIEPRHLTRIRVKILDLLAESSRLNIKTIAFIY